MAPRKSKISKPPSKLASRRAAKPTPPKELSKKSRKRPVPDAPPRTAIPTVPYTSLAARRRAKSTCSMASLLDSESEVTIEEKFMGFFGPTSENHFTWGKTAADPIPAIKRKGGKGQLRVKQLAGFTRGLFHWMNEGSPEPVIPNGPDRSPLLRLPLEIREKIYGYLLIHGRPVIIQYGWEAVEHKAYLSKAIISVCKQISTEASTFLYRNNVFCTVLHDFPSTFYRRNRFIISAKFIPMFKNVIIGCVRENYHLEWYEKACIFVKKLSEANASLDALTLITFPQRVGVTDTAVGTEAHAVTFADFLYVGGQLMEELKKLKCKVLRVVVQKTNDEGIIRRLLISLDLRYLHPVSINQGLIANAETIRLACIKASAVEKQLLGLKDRFEEVFEDDDRAMAEGKCRLLDSDDKF